MDTKNLSISVKQRLSNYARKNHLNYHNVATSFLLERLVARLTSEPSLYKSLVFKGGYVGLRIYESSRYTIDLDALLTNARLKETLTATRQSAEKDLENFKRKVDAGADKAITQYFYNILIAY